MLVRHLLSFLIAGAFISVAVAGTRLRADESQQLPKRFKNRGASVQKQIALAEGASEASEAAVEGALKWLASHQATDGSWSFDHTNGDCQGQCGNPGKLRDAKFAATGLALLTFLGRGETQQHGEYQRTIKSGLDYLCANMETTPNGGRMTRGGKMYGQAIATQALAEAYGLTQEKRLLAPAQAAVNFIAFAQDPIGGGWRYVPRQPGDMSSTGWQIMAVKHAYFSQIPVPKDVVVGALKFLDSVQSDGGAAYGYTGPGAGPATSAEGLLCRIHLGWEQNKPELRRGVEKLAAVGPTTKNLYFSYQVSQVLHEFDAPDGELWRAWNSKMRDLLINAQNKGGHEAGSWMFDGSDPGYEAGGRLYCTTLAALTLEVYYRYARIYQEAGAATTGHRILLQGRGQLAIVDGAGKIEWQMPWGGIHDLHVLNDGHILVQQGAAKIAEIDPATKAVVWSYNAATQNGNAGQRVEVHAFQPLDDGRLMIAESGAARIVEIDRQGTLLNEIKLKVDHPNPHTDTRLARKLATGNYLVCQEGDGTVREYDGKSGEIVWEYEVPLFGRQPGGGHGPEAFGNKCFAAVRLSNGNTLISTGNGHSVLEVTPDKKIVWQIGQHDLPGITLAWVTTLQVLANAHYMIGNCHAGADNPQLIELDPRTKKVVWTFHDFATFGNDVSNTHVLDAVAERP